MKLGRTIFKKGRDILKKRKKRQTKAHLQRKIKTSGKQKKNKQNGKKCPSYSKKIDGLKKKKDKERSCTFTDNIPTTFQLFKDGLERGREMTAPITKDAQNDINSTPRSTTLATALQLGHSCAGSASDRRCGSKPSLWALFLNDKRKENTSYKMRWKTKTKRRKFWFGVRKKEASSHQTT